LYTKREFLIILDYNFNRWKVTGNMSNEQKEKFLSIIVEAYEKGMATEKISADMMIDELKEKIITILKEKDPIAD
jgi:hypothetical protein